MNGERLNQIVFEMNKINCPQILVTDPASIFYLTGKWINPGERLLALYLRVDGKHSLFVNELFPISEDLGVPIVWLNDTTNSIELLSAHLIEKEPVGIDKNCPAKFLLELMDQKTGSSFINTSHIIDKLRMVKNVQEIELMREASKINDCAMEQLLARVPDCLTERSMGRYLIDIYDNLGAEGFSFDPIISYGSNCADPHHEPGSSLPVEGDSIIIDIGCRKSLYCSDMTRTVFYKSASQRARDVYQIVEEANQKAISAVKPGTRFSDIDAAARNHIVENGYGKFFTHRTGHSIGLEVHEYGDVSSSNKEIVTPGMIFSIEPGIYLPGEFGIRIEDLVVVTENGCEVLNQFNRDLIIIE